jgi:hypothetical protein
MRRSPAKPRDHIIKPILGPPKETSTDTELRGKATNRKNLSCNALYIGFVNETTRSADTPFGKARRRKRDVMPGLPPPRTILQGRERAAANAISGAMQ